jgi:hypothetical protein
MLTTVEITSDERENVVKYLLYRLNSTFPFVFPPLWIVVNMFQWAHVNKPFLYKSVYHDGNQL